MAAGDEFLGRRVVLFQPLGLEIRAVVSALFRSFVPIDPQPAQCAEDGFNGAGDVAALVGVLDTDDETAAVVTGKQPVEQGGADIANVGEAGGRRGVADPDGVGHIFTILLLRYLTVKQYYQDYQ